MSGDKRFKKDRSQKKYQIQRLWDMHHEILRRLVIGQKPVDIAEELGITPQTVSNVRNSPIVQRQIKMLQSQRDADAVTIRDRIDFIAPKAVQLLEKKLDEELVEDGEVTQVGVRAALGTLDFAVPKRGEINVKFGVDAELLTELKERARKSQMLSENTKDADFKLIEK